MLGNALKTNFLTLLNDILIFLSSKKFAFYHFNIITHIPLTVNRFREIWVAYADPFYAKKDHAPPVLRNMIFCYCEKAEAILDILFKLIPHCKPFADQTARFLPDLQQRFCAFPSPGIRYTAHQRGHIPRPLCAIPFSRHAFSHNYPAWILRSCFLLIIRWRSTIILPFSI